MTLLKWAGILVVLAVVAAILGFGGIAGAFVDVAQILFFVFLLGAFVIGLVGFLTYRKIKRSVH